MGKSLFYFALFLLLTASSAFAMDGCGAGACTNCHSLTIDEANELLRNVGKVKKIDPSPVNGLWLLELEKEGRQGMVFMDFRKKNLIAGTVFPLAARTEVGKPAATGAKNTKVDVASIPLENSIIMGNLDGKKRLFVFTDPECPFCARMHGELKKLAAMEPDLAIYVKMFPLKIHPRAYDKARVILAGGSSALLDKSYSGEPLPQPGQKDAPKPVDDTIRIAEALGIDSTPTLVLPDGRVIVGFREAAALRELLAAGKK